MSQKLVICTLKTQYQWVDIGSTRERVNSILALLRTITQEGCGKFSQSFSDGAENHECMAFMLMTQSSHDELHQLIDKACQPYYDIRILN